MCLLVLFGVNSAISASDNTLYFANHPALSPDGSTLYFSYEGDLWRVNTAGGEAMRITSMRGNETHPRISPDGKWIAFSGTEDGNANVYVMPVGGGDIRQLTFHDANDLVSSWTWDSKTIVFSSNRYNSVSSYTIPLEGGTPVRLFGHYFNIPHDLVYHPDGKEVFFTDTWESNNQVQRKRYKGAFNPDIRKFDLEKDTFSSLTDWEGKDLWPSMTAQGRLYFASDEVNGEYNLYTFDGGQKRNLTSFDRSVWYPQVNAGGTHIAFVMDYQLHVYDIGSGNTSKVPVRMGMSSVLEKDNRFAVAGNITAFDISPDKQKIAFISRGVLFVSDIKGKFISRIPTDDAERVTEVAWMKDNKRLIYGQTKNGWKNIFITQADAKGTPRQLTQTEAHNRDFVMNSDRSKMAWYAGRDKVMLMDLNAMSSRIIAEDELWGFQNGGMHFSPDGDWIAYNATRNFEKEVILVHIPTGKSINLTHTRVSENDPYFSPDGKYVYFATDRYKPSYPTGGVSTKIFRIALEPQQGGMRTAEFNRLFSEEKKDDKSKPVTKVQEEDLDRRWEQVTRGAGSQSRPFVINKGGKDFILYLSNQDGEGFTLWKTVQEEFESDKTEKFKGTRGPVSGLTLVDDKLYGLMGGEIHTVNYEAGSVEKITIAHSFTRNLRNEFDQMFFETWANIKENFYDETFRGLDWSAIRNRYASYLPHVVTRDQLREMINHMLGELNSSHLGFNSFGQEEATGIAGQTSWETGILFRQDQPYTVDRIVAFSPISYAATQVRAGDRLVAINGVSVNAAENRNRHFMGAVRPEELTLTFDRNGSRIDVLTKTTTSGGLRTLLYDEWMDANQRYVDEKSGKRIAYIHMKNMSGGELNRFMEEMANEAEYRDALILDLRNNTGGNVHDQVLQMLSQRKYSYWQYREGGRSTQPNFTPSDKPIILLQNEQSLSDAEMTANGFKALKLGTIMGTESYRWIIFTSAFSLVDGSNHRMPAWGVYDLDGNDLEMTGVAPDVLVNESFADRLKGRQPQLDRAIEEIMKQLR